MKYCFQLVISLAICKYALSFKQQATIIHVQNLLFREFPNLWIEKQILLQQLLTCKRIDTKILFHVSVSFQKRIYMQKDIFKKLSENRIL
jgi:hypothetical protein